MIVPAHLPADSTNQRNTRSTGSWTTGSINPFSFPSIREIVSASPMAARLLPQLMRHLADEIEGFTGVTSEVDADGLPTAPDAEAVARQIVEGLSETLSRHLKTSRDMNALDAGSRMIGNYARPAAHATYDRRGGPEIIFEEPSRVALQVVHDHLSDEGAGEPKSEGDSEATVLRHLQLKLLGTPEITLNGVRLEAVERSSRVGLIPYILALHPRGLSVERLAAYLATDSLDLDALDTDATMGLGTVRTFIWRLRKIAGWRDIVVSAAEHGGCSNVYRLPAGTSCDLWEFESNLDQSTRLAVRANVDPGAADRAATLRQEAILLYGGDFCNGVSAGCISHAGEQLRIRYLNAVLQQANYWKDRSTRVRDSRLQPGSAITEVSGVTRPVAGPPTAEEQSAWLEALSNYRLAIRAEPYDEAAYVGAMLCLAHLGNSKGVQETFALCSRVIKAELDRAPLASTIHAAEEYRALAAG